MERTDFLRGQILLFVVSFPYESPLSCYSFIFVSWYFLTRHFLFYKKVFKHFPILISGHVTAALGMLYRLRAVVCA